MQHVTFYFDVVSPYAYLAFERIPHVLEGLSYEVHYQPVLLAGLLSHFGQKGPAEIEPKRAWTFRHAAWMARQHGLPLQMPSVHPFNPLPLLRLALAVSARGLLPNRWICEQLFRHVWCSEDGPQDPNDPQRLAALTSRLVDSAVARGRTPDSPQSPHVKQSLKDATDRAIDLGVFGVPHMQANGRRYFGLVALELLSSALRGDTWFSGGTWDEVAAQRPGVNRLVGPGKTG